MLKYFVVFIGAGLGGASRLFVTQHFTIFLQNKYPNVKIIQIFPCATMLVNIIGSILIGYVSEILILKFANSPIAIKLFCITGVFGGFTTFSSFSLESVTLLHNQCYTAFLLYILFSLTICIIGCLMGMKIAKLF